MGNSFFSAVLFQPVIIGGVICSYILANFLGALAGHISHKQPRLTISIGVVTGFSIIFITTIIVSLLDFFTQGLANNNASEALNSYIHKPIALLTLYGFLPILLGRLSIGFTLKYQLKKIKG